MLHLQKSDLGLAPIPITSDRNKVVDFTPPYDSSNLVVIVKVVA